MAVRVSQGLVYSLFEVEEVLSRHPAVLKLLAFTVAHVELGDVLGVAVVEAAPVTVGELRAFGSGLLPTSLLPTVLVWVDELSGMPWMGRTLRDELPALLQQRHAKARDFGDTGGASGGQKVAITTLSACPKG